MSITDSAIRNYSPAEVKQRAHQAKALLQDPLLTESMEESEREVLALFKRDPTKNDLAWGVMAAIELIRKNLWTLVNDGEVANTSSE